MEQIITMRRSRKGIDIVVVIKKNSYDLFIDITTEADLSKKIVDKDYILKFKLLDGSKRLDEPFHLELLDRKYKENQVMNNSKYTLKNRKYRFEISLFPSLYVFPEKLDEARKKQMRKKNSKKSKKSISLKGIRKPGLASPKYTKYTHSNIARPYRGGSCTPK